MASEPGYGGVTFTTKELLERIDNKLDALDAKLDTKADREHVHDLRNALAAAEGRWISGLHGIEGRVATLEATTVKREGPIIEELRGAEKHVADLKNEVQRLQNGVGRQIQEAIRTNNREIRETRDRSFTKFEKIALLVVAAIGAVGTLVSIYVLLQQAGTAP